MRERLSAKPRVLGRTALREQVDRGADRRPFGDLVVHRRVDVRFGDKLPTQPNRQRYRATFCDLADTGLDAQSRERSDLVLKTAREDALETREVGRNVQRETVRRDTARYADADRADLRGAAIREIDPHARLPALRARRDAVAGERVAHRVLDRAHVSDEVLPLAERDDRIANELPRAVGGDVATTIDPVHSCAHHAQDVPSDK